MYYIGIDFGYEETCVSRIPGYNGEPYSTIPLQLTRHDHRLKVNSALCKKEGRWSFAWGRDDLTQPDIREGFIGPINKLNEKDRESMREFAKLIFSTILANDQELQYNPISGEKNFDVCIACPSSPKRLSINPNTLLQYKSFFRKECGVPVKVCINNSDAVFYYSKCHQYIPMDTVLLINLESSTMDFTTYHNSEYYPECCWGDNQGLDLIDDILVEKIFEDTANHYNIRRAIEARKNTGLGSVDAKISLAIRRAREDFYINQADDFEIGLRFYQLVPGWSSKAECVFDFVLTRKEFHYVIERYKHKLKFTFENAVQKLKNQGIKPTHILLSGDAGWMGFVQEYASSIFSEATILTMLPRCAADGAAEYARSLQRDSPRIFSFGYK